MKYLGIVAALLAFSGAAAADEPKPWEIIPNDDPRAVRRWLVVDVPATTAPQDVFWSHFAVQCRVDAAEPQVVRWLLPTPPSQAGRKA